MLTGEQRQEIIRLLEQGEDLSPEWARILFPPEKREYELVYHGKEREEDILADTLAVPLQPVRTFGTNGGAEKDEWRNMLIFGDNLQVMKSLLEMKKTGKLCNADGTPGFRLIYIDPPFATKQEFRGSQDQKAYQDKIAGSRFLEFLRKRLVFLRELLSEDGSIYVHLDWKKGHYVKVLLDEILGEQRFQNEVIWKRTSARSDSRSYNHIHDLIYFYSKSKDFIWNKQFTAYGEEYLKKFYRHIEEKTGRRYTLSDLMAAGVVQSGSTGKVWRGVNPAGKGNHWKYPIEKLEELDKEGRIYWPSKGGVPRYKRYLDEMEGVVLQSIWADINPVSAQSEEKIGYPTQKPETLLERIIKASSNPGDFVLDCFAGSGTTLAAADKLGRRWIGVDCGKLAIYTMQKRLLNIAESKDLENSKKKYGKSCKPFVLYNAGLYDFSKLNELPWESWRFFALQLFQGRDEPHTIGGIKLDGYLKGSSVLVFNHMREKGVRIDEETVASLHEALGSRIGSKLFIIAPAMTFDFQQDYITLDGVRYYALRIPYSIINELHQREFTCLKQPSDEMAVNDTVEAVGFDFIRTPELKFDCGVRKGKGSAPDIGFIRIKTFKSEAVVREPMLKKGNMETLSIVMLDYDFDDKLQVFDLDQVFYADALEKGKWELHFPPGPIGRKLMAIFIDIYGNEARVVIGPEQFGISETKKKREWNRQ